MSLGRATQRARNSPQAINILRAHVILPRLHTFHSASAVAAASPVRTPHPPIELDPALQALLQDADFSLQRSRITPRPPRELEVLTSRSGPTGQTEAEEAAEEARLFPRNERKSPAASFGSRGVGAVVLPFELQRSILRLLNETDKPQVHADATRLFQTAEDAWSTRYTPPERQDTPPTRMAHIRARMERQRDGTAFASVVMPAQYAVIKAVLEGIVTRLGPVWAGDMRHVVEWGSGTGAGMWAALHAFGGSDGEATLSKSHISTYTGIEPREGLTAIARRLMRDIPLGTTSITLQKSLRRPNALEGSGTLALSAFALSTLSNPGLRRQMVRDMWESGADVMVIIDDASAEGFRHVSDARELLLKFGRRELDPLSEDPLTADLSPGPGVHIVAPCPHERTCPLLLAASSGVRCTFSQRLQRPSFVRRTKHEGQGEEDVGYAYVVVRRGPRPVPTWLRGEEEGRVGAVGRWEEEALLDKEAEQGQQNGMWEGLVEEEIIYGAPVSEPVLDEADEAEVDIDEVDMDAAEAAGEAGEVELDAAANFEPELTADESPAEEPSVAEDLPADAGTPPSPVFSDQALEDALRLEAYCWPRINFPPLKRSGHIIIDACMPNGHEMRLTYPRSQGKQIYYDARKSSWGDLFPHPPKNRPLPRYAGPGTPAATDGPREKGRGIGRGGEGALAKVGQKGAKRARWGGVAEELKQADRERRRERKARRNAKEMSDDDFN